MKEIKSELGARRKRRRFYGPHQSVRDGAMTTALLLGIMAKTGKKLSELVENNRQYF
jgi:phosphomannomutase